MITAFIISENNQTRRLKSLRHHHFNAEQRYEYLTRQIIIYTIYIHNRVHIRPIGLNLRGNETYKRRKRQKHIYTCSK